MRLLVIVLLCVSMGTLAQRPRDYGIEIGVLPTGKQNAITDVEGVRVGHKTLIIGDSVRTGVTAILPHPGNVFQYKVPGAIYIGNGFGKLAGISQVQELGTIETPIILTNTLSVPTASDAIISYTINHPENSNVHSVNPLVGETNDGYLNDIRGRHVKAQDILDAILVASNQTEEGNVGAGTGTICFGFKGGIGTSSRVLPADLGGYTIGVIVQTNFGGVLQIDGVPVGVELEKYYLKNQLQSADGSCMIIVATDAPISSRNLERVAKRAMMGLAKTGGIASNGSGDYVIAFSTSKELREEDQSEFTQTGGPELRNDRMSPIFMATIEATEEAIINSLFAAETMTSGKRTIEQLPIDRVMQIMDAYNRKK